jgi:hypothetical protein
LEGAALSDQTVSTDHDYSIAEFCEASRISLSTFHALKRQGLGPREMEIGGSIRISHEARLDWKREMEARAASKEGRRRAAARKKKTVDAANLSVQSPKHVSKQGKRVIK